jgi:hypothetical protein
MHQFQLWLWRSYMCIHPRGISAVKNSVSLPVHSPTRNLRSEKLGKLMQFFAWINDQKLSHINCIACWILVKKCDNQLRVARTQAPHATWFGGPDHRILTTWLLSCQLTSYFQLGLCHPSGYGLLPSRELVKIAGNGSKSSCWARLSMLCVFIYYYYYCYYLLHKPKSTLIILQCTSVDANSFCP